MKTARYITIYLLVLLPFFIFLVPSVKAQENHLTVAPARQILQADPGETKYITVKFINQADQAVTGKFGAADFIVTDKEGTPTFLDENPNLTSKYRAASWISLPLQKGTIAAIDKVTIQAKIIIPQDARPGGRYFGIFFEPTTAVPTAKDFELSTGMGVGSRIAGLVYLKISGPITEQALVTKFETPGFVEYGPVSVFTEILNRGNYHIRPKGNITLTNSLGGKVDEIELKEVNIFPDTSRVFENEIGGKYLIGKHTLKLTALYGEGNQVLSSTTTFWAFPWRLALVILLSIIIIILVSIVLWKTLKGKQTKLENKLEKEIDELESLKNRYRDPNPSHKAK